MTQQNIKLVPKINFYQSGGSAKTNMFSKGLKYVGKGIKNTTNAISGKKFKVAVEKAKIDAQKAGKRLENYKNKASVNNTIDLKKQGRLEKQLNKKQTQFEDAQNALNKFKKRRNRIITGASLVGSLGAGIPAAVSLSNTSSENNVTQEEKQPAQYRFDKQRGWQEFNPETNQYEDQQIGFGVDSGNNTNFYDGNTWLKPDQYIQSSDGYIYDSRTGQPIGISKDMLDAKKAGYDNLFDYKASLLGLKTPEQVAKLQEDLGITVDGKFGQQTQNAVLKALNKSYSDSLSPENLFTLYKRN